MPTTIKRNAGGTFAFNLKFYGPPESGGALGPAFDLAGWEVDLIDAKAQIKNNASITVTDEAAGEVRLFLDGTSDLPPGTEKFRLQLVDGTGFRVSFPVIQLQIGDYNVADFDGEPPYLLLSGRDGVQLTVAPAEPEIIFGPTSVAVTHLGSPVTHLGSPVTTAA